ncbi:MAG TPA: tetratricopeptide repeat protein, partial [Dehalococcoidia bacterium]|nr:tetratricopeptide repeat protein [Dehalococcoidia bacterium]
NNIAHGTATLEELDVFLGQTPKLPPHWEEYLFSWKASLLLQQGRAGEALDHCDAALKIHETAFAHYFRGMALLAMGRHDDGFKALQRAYLLRQDLGKHEPIFLMEELRGWSKVALVLGLLGILTQDPGAMQKGVDEYIGVLDRARANSMEGEVTKLPLPSDTTDMIFGDLQKAAEETYANAGLPFTPDVLERVHQAIEDAQEELELAVRLLSIKDPFEGWRALSQEISKVWPKDVSAVDAIREQRDREWNR